MPEQTHDRRYFEARIERELALAKSAAHPEAARVHSTLAELYLDRLGLKAEPGLSERVHA
jgi:hypothetical protein